MILRSITNDAENDLAIREVNRLWPKNGEELCPKLDALVTMIDVYERKRYPTREMDPIEVLHGAIEHAVQNRDELSSLFGSTATADKVMARDLPLTLDMIHAVSDAWGIPLCMLTRKYLPKSEATQPK